MSHSHIAHTVSTNCDRDGCCCCCCYCCMHMHTQSSTSIGNELDGRARVTLILPLRICVRTFRSKPKLMHLPVNEHFACNELQKKKNIWEKQKCNMLFNQLDNVCAWLVAWDSIRRNEQRNMLCRKFFRIDWIAVCKGWGIFDPRVSLKCNWYLYPFYFEANDQF